ncbi:hypothetical protein SAMN05192529_10959 [Arachidicoccus rhizosphaerae]|uniref:Uncharacterized protein n=1 Tax=Arachidicoccus rhizosphaerae TaxID=551991 RepID=A0A1H3YUA2_9BACT|nr:hypothetical protein [Arachidicoccus rhizosphaerae]SEA15133.1 hypothetical protein SAMN05192529_10959 [Arachidicoccus rhizosphaerae]
MKESFLPKQETLLTELRNWKNTESLCGNVYNDEAVKSRRFQKLKMQTYQVLYGKYKGTSLSSDEKALHQMLRHQYKQIELKLYPNALARVGMRAWNAARRKVEGLVNGGAKPENRELFNAAGLTSVISANGAVNVAEPSVAKSKEQQMENSSRPERWVNDLGRKSKGQEKSQKMEIHRGGR